MSWTVVVLHSTLHSGTIRTLRLITVIGDALTVKRIRRLCLREPQEYPYDDGRLQ